MQGTDSGTIFSSQKCFYEMGQRSLHSLPSSLRERTAGYVGGLASHNDIVVTIEVIVPVCPRVLYVPTYPAQYSLFAIQNIQHRRSGW
jgi:hypothetical protein